MPKNYPDMSLEEKTNYWDTFHQTCDTLRFAIIDLQVAAAGAQLASAASVILAEILRLQSELALLDNHSTAVSSGTAAITPPSAGDVATVTALARQVDVMTVDSNTYQSVVQLADQALQTYGKMKA